MTAGGTKVGGYASSLLGTRHRLRGHPHRTRVAEDYADDVLAEARGAVDRHAGEREDRTDLPLVTIDPPTSMDLDQAVHIARDGGDFVIDYAIADVAALIEPEGALDQESRRRGTTVYFPDGSVPLHPRSCPKAPDHCCPTRSGRACCGPSGCRRPGSPWMCGCAEPPYGRWPN